MPSERFMQHHYGPSGFVKRGTKFCARCHHPQDWHRLDDSKNVPPTDPEAQFRCIGYDCEAHGKPKHDACDCPDFVEPVGSADKEQL